MYNVLGLTYGTWIYSNFEFKHTKTILVHLIFYINREYENLTNINYAIMREKPYLFNIDTSLHSDCSIKRQQILFMNALTRNHFL